MTEKETRGVLWLKDEMEAYTVNVHPKDVTGDIIFKSSIGAS